MKKISVILILFCLHTLVLFVFFHVGLFGSLVFFYRGMVYIVFTSFLLLLSFYAVHTYVSFTSTTQIAVVCVFFSLQSMFFVLVPVTLDRSVSVFLLKHMAATSKQILSADELEAELIRTYIRKNRAIEKRIIEQIQTRSIQKKQDGYYITNTGRLLVRLYELIGWAFGIRT